MRWGWVLVAMLVLVGLIPVLALGVASTLTALAGCHAPGGFAQPCPMAGLDWAPFLHGLDLTGRFFFLTAPIALAGFVLGIALALAALMRRARD